MRATILEKGLERPRGHLFFRQSPPKSICLCGNPGQGDGLFQEDVLEKVLTGSLAIYRQPFYPEGGRQID